MITKVSGLDSRVVVKDPRRKAQSIQFRHDMVAAPKNSYEAEYERQQRNALWTSASIVVGSVLFTVGYFALSTLKRVKP